jgi:uncharacterized damage-inducible protein DinB
MDLSYPIGNFNWPQTVTPEQRSQMIGEIAAAPAKFREAVRGLDDSQLDTQYRPDGWTVRQVIHHVADSHMNSYIRFRLALTEEQPAVKGYEEKDWAQLHDSHTMPVEVSLQLLDGLHGRWVDMLSSMTDADFERSFRHSDKGLIRLDQNLALYAWHSRHHAAHITGLRERMGWV